MMRAGELCAECRFSIAIIRRVSLLAIFVVIPILISSCTNVDRASARSATTLSTVASADPHSRNAAGSSESNPCAPKGPPTFRLPTSDGREIVVVATGSRSRSSAVRTFPFEASVKYALCIGSSAINLSNQTVIVFDLTSHATAEDISYIESAFRSTDLFEKVYETSGMKA